MSAASRMRHVRLAISSLLILCLVTAVAKTQYPAGLRGPGAAPIMGFTPALTDIAGASLGFDRRPRANSCNGLYTPPIPDEFSFNSARESSPFTSEARSPASYDQGAATPIRAPPCLKSDEV